jgi:hypothetical protein
MPSKYRIGGDCYTARSFSVLRQGSGQMTHLRLQIGAVRQGLQDFLPLHLPEPLPEPMHNHAGSALVGSKSLCHRGVINRPRGPP